MSEAIDNFRAITNDPSFPTAEIAKLLKWSKGDLQQALNYYYRRVDKAHHSKVDAPEVATSKAETQTSKEPPSVFGLMKKASLRQEKTDSFIREVRRDYELPIQGKGGKKVEDQAEGEIDQQFRDADYLPSIFQHKDVEVGRRTRNKEYSANPKELPNQRRTRKSTSKRGLPYQQQDQESHRQDNRESKHKDEKQSQMEEEQPPSHPPQQQQIQKEEKEWSVQNEQAIRCELAKNVPPKPLYAMNMEEPEMFLASILAIAFSTSTQPMLDYHEGDLLEYEYHIAEQKSKKMPKGFMKAERAMNMRLMRDGRSFGRIRDEDVRILVPLLHESLIRVQIYAKEIPKRLETFTKMMVEIRVSLLRKAITEPVIETYQGKSLEMYRKVANEIVMLFDRVSIGIKKHALIKNKSRASKDVPLSIEPSKEVEKVKQMNEDIRRQTDPFFKTTQLSLTDMIRKQTGVSRDSSSSSQKEEKIVYTQKVAAEQLMELVDLYEEDIEPFHPTSHFQSTLYTYQALALAWMLRLEGRDGLQEELHPLWTELEAPTPKYRLFLNQLTSQISVKPPMSASKCRGGILADQMGLGKTVMMAALIASTKGGNGRIKKEMKCPIKSTLVAPTLAASTLVAPTLAASTLVIVPLTLLSQWQSQLQKHTKGVTSLIYYSTDRSKYMKSLDRFDVVITTYGTVSHEFNRGMHISKGGLYRHKWYRVILDEAHYIKGRIIQTAKAVYELEAGARWCLTGTPIQNNLTDLFSLIHFIRYSPWSEYQCWSKYITRPHEMGDSNVYDVLRTILKRVFLRRTKQSKDSNGENIVDLPLRVSEVEVLTMSAREREFYDTIFEASKLKIEELERMGVLEARYMQVLEILIRLRQICCHPILFKAITKYVRDPKDYEHQLRKFIAKRETLDQDVYFEPLIEGDEERRVENIPEAKYNEAYFENILNRIISHEFQHCLICLNDVEDGVITVCLHIFCKSCAIRQIEECGSCSACRRRLTKEDYMHLPRDTRFNHSIQSEDYYRSTKLLALEKHLSRLQAEDKAVIFSQFLGMMDLIEKDLKQMGLGYVRMEGSTTHRERTRIVQSFQQDPKVQVFLVSLKTAGVGLNLVEANRVFLMDPWWNPGVEEQAIERVHRIGQKREVRITRFIMDRSIQMRMLELNRSKKHLSNIVLNQQGGKGEDRVQKLKYLMEKY